MRHRTIHRGTTLVEMVLLLTVSSMVLVLTLQVLKRTIGVQQSCVREAASLRARYALSHRLRLDAARATEAALDDQRQLRLVNTAAEQVLYRMSEPGWVWREVQRDNQIVSRDRWHLDGVGRWSLSLEPSGTSGALCAVVRVEFASLDLQARPSMCITARIDSTRALLASAPERAIP